MADTDCPTCGAPTTNIDEHCTTCMYGLACYLQGYGTGVADDRLDVAAYLRAKHTTVGVAPDGTRLRLEDHQAFEDAAAIMRGEHQNAAEIMAASLGEPKGLADG